MVWPSNNAGGEIDYLLVSPIDVPAQVADDLIRRRRRPPIPSDPAAWEGTSAIGARAWHSVWKVWLAR